MKKQNIVMLAILALAIVVAGGAYLRQRQKAQDIVDDSAVRTVVMQFGASIQKVSLSAPDALDEIADTYAPYASSSLIEKWKENKSFTPGKGVSSPWPSSINITAVTKKADSYVVQGMVAEVTSQEVAHGGIAAEYPVTITLHKYGNVWLMTSYDPGVETTFAPKVPSTSAQ